MKAYMIFSIVLPLLRVFGTAWLNISTLGNDTENFFNKLMVSGHVRVLPILQCCTTCRKLSTRPMVCKHMQDDTPPWIDPIAQGVVKEMYGLSHEAQFARENLGFNVDAGPECFPRKAVQDLFARPRASLHKEAVSHVFVGIDPAAGSRSTDGHSSDFAVVSICEPGCLILGAEAIDVSGMMDLSYQRLVVEHLHKLQRVPELTYAKFVVGIESNFGGVMLAALQAAIAEGLPNRVVFLDDERKLGLLTTARSKENQYIMLREALNRGQVAVYENFVTGYTTKDGRPDPARILGELEGQLLRYKKMFEPPTTQWGKPRFTISGKLSSEVPDVSIRAPARRA